MEALMPFEAHVLKVIIASPGDVSAERVVSYAD